MLVNKRCTYCGGKFQAKTTKTKYCSLSCNQKHYKQKERKTRQLLVKNEEITDRHPFSERLELIKIKEFLTIQDCSILLNVSRSTIKRLLERGDLLSFNVLGRVLISRSDLDHFYKGKINTPSVKKVEVKNTEFDERKYYFMGEIPNYYNVSTKSIERHIKLKGIKKIKRGRFNYVLKNDIKKLYGAPTKK